MNHAMLGLESADALASVAVMKEDGQLHTATAQAGQTHSSQLLPLAEELLGKSGLNWQSLEGLVVGIGPGSFTGLRIACGIAQGLSLGLQRPCYPVSGFEAAAYAWWSTQVHGEYQQFLIEFDARLGESFAAILEFKNSGLQTHVVWIVPPMVVQKAAVSDLGLGIRDDQALIKLSDPLVSTMGNEALPMSGWMMRYARDPQLNRPSQWIHGAELTPLYVREKVAQTIIERQQGADLQWSEMRAEDLEAVMAIENTAYPFPWTIGNFRDSLSAGYRLKLLRERGVLIGYVVWMPVLQEAHLLNITLAPPRQGHGLGTWMMRSVMQQMQAEGLQQILLEVRPSNHRALALYRRLGFAQIGIRKGYYPNSATASVSREDAVVMRQSLEH
ncbi:MAG: tRNA (adenosine(37)-N6)-threonylcarbamoyltransferase complex dimerization subunit type 1 TsaB [Betaproteobacteria bacterium]|nr:tRNA (adenosine(37)-N6)-threonylcarbamoyltransferase complex dimerization subunit type 1 TsaB [Betaproteobacteria bacterium]